MKVLLILLTLLFTYSCAHNSFQDRKYQPGKFKAPKSKVAKVKTSHSSNEIVEVIVKTKESSTEYVSKTKESTSTPITEKTLTQDKIINQQNESRLFAEQDEEAAQEDEIITIPNKPLDDTVFLEADSPQATYAQKAENKGIASLVLGILSFFIPFGLVAAIIGLVLAKQSLRAQYNTQTGISLARAGKIVSIISIVLRVLLVIFLIALIFALGF